MRLPESLLSASDGAAIELLSCYYGRGTHNHHPPFTGSWFDTWDSTGTRTADADRFTADDVVAVSFLSVNIPPLATRHLLVGRADTFSALLTELGPDRDLVRETDPWDHQWPGSRLWEALHDLPGVGPTMASKLYARKRPRLRPIYDTVVAKVIGENRLWEPLRAELQANPGLHPRLERLRDLAGLPSGISAVRVFDVLAWMEGSYGHDCPWPLARGVST